MNLIKDNIDFSKYYEESELNESINQAGDYLDETLSMMFPDPSLPRPPSCLWEKTKGRISFRPSEVTLWAGINGHGKSMFLSQVTLDLLHQKQKILVISLEMTPAAQMVRMSTQANAGNKTVESTTNFINSITKDLYIYNQQGSMDWKKIMAVCRYSKEKYGIQHFIIDSLMKSVKGEDDYNGQKDFITAACSFAMAHGSHVHIVHHVRKGENEGKIPDKFDIRGASSIVDQVDNVIVVFRNKKNEELETPSLDSPTAVLNVVKNRHGDFEGKLGFWFDKDTLQYLERPDSIPFKYAFKLNYGITWDKFNKK
jgi:twinkle protein